SSGRALESALDHGSDQRAPIGGAGVNIVLRIDGGRRRGLRLRNRRFVDRLSVEDGFCRVEAQGPVAGADGAHMGVASLPVRLLVVEYGCRSHGEIAATAGEFLESPAPPRGPGPQPDFGNDL